MKTFGKRKLSPYAKDSAISYGLVTAAFVIVSILNSMGLVSSSLQGQLVSAAGSFLSAFCTLSGSSFFHAGVNISVSSSLPTAPGRVLPEPVIADNPVPRGSCHFTPPIVPSPQHQKQSGSIFRRIQIRQNQATLIYFGFL